ncbi:MAG: restriction endonuclease subunit S, partial [Selenomonadaceae bacterium]|nr:restriction endonuclease subunit S [Selenomonadaceae bacterium]
MFADRLKKSLLQAAIQGQLTEQLPTDGDARDLLKKIRAEKAKLLAEKKIKAEKSLPTVTDNEISFDIPDSWCWVRLGDIALKIHYGFTTSTRSEGNVKLLRITDIQNDEVCWELVPRCTVTDSQKKDYLLKDGDIVIARTGGTVGKTFVVENLSDETIFASYLIRVIFNENISSKYIKIFAGSPLYWRQIIDKSQGTGQPNVNGKSLSNLILPLPPFAEQKRIVEKLNELLPEVDELAKDERELVELEETFPHRMRNSLLQAAIQGKLTEQLPSDGNARDLLRKIRTEKVKLIAEKKIKSEKPLPPVTDDDIPFDLPDNWCWCRLGEVCDTNIGLTYNPQNIVDDGVIVLRSGNIVDSKVDYKDLVKVNLTIPENKLAYVGDILICVRNGSKRLVGKAAIIDKNGVSFGAFMAVVRSAIAPYLFKVIISPYFRRTLIDDVGTTTINQITQNMLKNFLVPLPPLSEQKRIVERLKELL